MADPDANAIPQSGFQIIELPVETEEPGIITLPLAHVLKVADEQAERQEPV